MTKSYIDIQKQIAALRKDAQKVRSKEVRGVIARIRQAVDAYGLTAADLGLDRKRRQNMGAAPLKVKKPGRKAKSSVVKYRDGDNAWSGRGRRPQWLAAALAEGKALEQFAV